MENAKRVGKRQIDAKKAVVDERLRENECNTVFRTIDRDLKTIRPDLIKLQDRKKQLSRYIHVAANLFSSICLPLLPRPYLIISSPCTFLVLPLCPLPPPLSSSSQLQQMGWTQQEISERVKEAAMSESESIYGTLYGCIGKADK